MENTLPIRWSVQDQNNFDFLFILQYVKINAYILFGAKYRPAAH